MELDTSDCDAAVSDQPICSQSLPNEIHLSTQVSLEAPLNPNFIEIKTSGVDKHKQGVWCTKLIEKGTKLGPLSGDKIHSDVSADVDTRFLWEVKKPGSEDTDHYLVASEPTQRNFAWYIGCARYFEEQNIISSQEDTQVYFVALKDIQPGEELLAWYEKVYVKKQQQQVRKSKRKSVQPDRSYMHKVDPDILDAVLMLEESIRNEELDFVDTKPSTPKQKKKLRTVKPKINSESRRKSEELKKEELFVEDFDYIDNTADGQSPEKNEESNSRKIGFNVRKSLDRSPRKIQSETQHGRKIRNKRKSNSDLLVGHSIEGSTGTVQSITDIKNVNINSKHLGEKPGSMIQSADVDLCESGKENENEDRSVSDVRSEFLEGTEGDFGHMTDKTDFESNEVESENQNIHSNANQSEGASPVRKVSLVKTKTENVLKETDETDELENLEVGSVADKLLANLDCTNKHNNLEINSKNVPEWCESFTPSMEKDYHGEEKSVHGPKCSLDECESVKLDTDKPYTVDVHLSENLAQKECEEALELVDPKPRKSKPPWFKSKQRKSSTSNEINEIVNTESPNKEVAILPEIKKCTENENIRVEASKIKGHITKHGQTQGNDECSTQSNTGKRKGRGTPRTREQNNKKQRKPLKEKKCKAKLDQNTSKQNKDDTLVVEIGEDLNLTDNAFDATRTDVNGEEKDDVWKRESLLSYESQQLKDLISNMNNDDDSRASSSTLIYEGVGDADTCDVGQIEIQENNNQSASSMEDTEPHCGSGNDGEINSAMPQSQVTESAIQGFQFDLKDHHCITGRLGRKIYKCDICSGIYRHPFSLKRHFLRSHINPKYISNIEVTNGKIMYESVSTRDKLKVANEDTVDADLEHRDNLPVEKILPEIGNTDESNLNADFTEDKEEVCVESSKNLTSICASPKQVPATSTMISGSELPAAVQHSGPAAMPWLFRCNICSSTFNTANTLKTHIMAHPSIPGKQTYACSHCDMKFTQKPNLMRHQVVHTGSKPPSKSSEIAFRNRKKRRIRSKLTHRKAKRSPNKSQAKGEEEKETQLESNKLMEDAEEVDNTGELKNITFSGSKSPRQKATPESNESATSAPSTVAKRLGLTDKTMNQLGETGLKLRSRLLEDMQSSFKFTCTVCKKRFREYTHMCRHRHRAHQNPDQRNENQKNVEASSMKSRIKTPESNDHFSRKAKFYQNIGKMVSTNLKYQLHGKEKALANFGKHLRYFDHVTKQWKIQDPTILPINYSFYNFPTSYKGNSFCLIPNLVAKSPAVKDDSRISSSLPSSSPNKMPELHKCPVCQILFRLSEDYMGHLKTVHEIDLSAEMQPSEIDKKSEMMKENTNLLDNKNLCNQNASKEQKINSDSRGQDHTLCRSQDDEESKAMGLVKRGEEIANINSTDSPNNLKEEADAHIHNISHCEKESNQNSCEQRSIEKDCSSENTEVKQPEICPHLSTSSDELADTEICQSNEMTVETNSLKVCGGDLNNENTTEEFSEVDSDEPPDITHDKPSRKPSIDSDTPPDITKGELSDSDVDVSVARCGPPVLVRAAGPPELTRIEEDLEHVPEGKGNATHSRVAQFEITNKEDRDIDNDVVNSCLPENTVNSETLGQGRKGNEIHVDESSKPKTNPSGNEGKSKHFSLGNKDSSSESPKSGHLATESGPHKDENNVGERGDHQHNAKLVAVEDNPNVNLFEVHGTLQEEKPVDDEITSETTQDDDQPSLAHLIESNPSGRCPCKNESVNCVCHTRSDESTNENHLSVPPSRGGIDTVDTSVQKQKDLEGYFVDADENKSKKEIESNSPICSDSEDDIPLSQLCKKETMQMVRPEWDYNYVDHKMNIPPRALGLYPVQRCYVCLVCKERFPDFDTIFEHEVADHPNIDCRHVFIEHGYDPQVLDYRYLDNNYPNGSFPIAQKRGPSTRTSMPLSCTKCKKKYRNMDELHYHIIEECAEKRQPSHQSGKGKRHGQVTEGVNKSIENKENRRGIKHRIVNLRVVSETAKVPKQVNKKRKRPKQKLCTKKGKQSVLKKQKINMAKKVTKPTFKPKQLLKKKGRVNSSKIVKQAQSQVLKEDQGALSTASINTKEQIQKCHGCSKKFSTISLLVKHVRWCSARSKIRKTKEIIQANTRSKSLRTCKYCGRFFIYRGSIINHLRSYCDVRKDLVKQGKVGENDWIKDMPRNDKDGIERSQKRRIKRLTNIMSRAKRQKDLNLKPHSLQDIDVVASQVNVKLDSSKDMKKLTSAKSSRFMKQKQKINISRFNAKKEHTKGNATKVNKFMSKCERPKLATDVNIGELKTKNKKVTRENWKLNKQSPRKKSDVVSQQKQNIKVRNNKNVLNPKTKNIKVKRKQSPVGVGKELGDNLTKSDELQKYNKKAPISSLTSPEVPNKKMKMNGCSLQEQQNSVKNKKVISITVPTTTKMVKRISNKALKVLESTDGKKTIQSKKRDKFRVETVCKEKGIKENEIQSTDIHDNPVMLSRENTEDLSNSVGEVIKEDLPKQEYASKVNVLSNSIKKSKNAKTVPKPKPVKSKSVLSGKEQPKENHEGVCKTNNSTQLSMPSATIGDSNDNVAKLKEKKDVKEKPKSSVQKFLAMIVPRRATCSSNNSNTELPKTDVIKKRSRSTSPSSVEDRNREKNIKKRLIQNAKERGFVTCPRSRSPSVNSNAGKNGYLEQTPRLSPRPCISAEQECSSKSYCDTSELTTAEPQSVIVDPLKVVSSEKDGNNTSHKGSLNPSNKKPDSFSVTKPVVTTQKVDDLDDIINSVIEKSKTLSKAKGAKESISGKRKNKGITKVKAFFGENMSQKPSKVLHQTSPHRKQQKSVNKKLLDVSPPITSAYKVVKHISKLSSSAQFLKKLEEEGNITWDNTLPSVKRPNTKMLAKNRPGSLVSSSKIKKGNTNTKKKKKSVLTKSTVTVQKPVKEKANMKSKSALSTPVCNKVKKKTDDWYRENSPTETVSELQSEEIVVFRDPILPRRSKSPREQTFASSVSNFPSSEEPELGSDTAKNENDHVPHIGNMSTTIEIAKIGNDKSKGAKGNMSDTNKGKRKIETMADSGKKKLKQNMPESDMKTSIAVIDDTSKTKQNMLEVTKESTIDCAKPDKTRRSRSKSPRSVKCPSQGKYSAQQQE